MSRNEQSIRQERKDGFTEMPSCERTEPDRIVAVAKESPAPSLGKSRRASSLLFAEKLPSQNRVQGIKGRKIYITFTTPSSPSSRSSISHKRKESLGDQLSFLHPSTHPILQAHILLLLRIQVNNRHRLIIIIVIARISAVSLRRHRPRPPSDSDARDDQFRDVVLVLIVVA